MRARIERGFTLMEVLVALCLLSISISVVTSGLMNNLRSNRNMQVRYEAIQAAQSVLDRMRFEDIAALSAPRTENVVIGTRTYAVATQFCKISSMCISDDVRHITTDVTYKSELVYETDTVFSKFK